MKDNTKTTNTKQIKKTDKTMAQKVSEIAKKEVFMKKVDRDIFGRSVLITSLAVNLATFALLLFLAYK